MSTIVIRRLVWMLPVVLLGAVSMRWPNAAFCAVLAANLVGFAEGRRRL